MSDAILSPVRDILQAVATTVVPESASLDDSGWADLYAVIDNALAEREPGMQRQLLVFLRLLQLLPIVRHGKPLTRLGARERTRFLASVERAPLLLMRRGIWGVRTLIFMGYYTCADVTEAIGYRASPGGWTTRGGTSASVPLAPTLWVEP